MLGGVRHTVLILHEYLFDVTWHGQVDRTVVVVPLEFDAAVQIPGPILGKFVFLFNACN